MLPFMLISHLVLSLVPKLSPDAPTTCGMFIVSKSLSFNSWYIFQNMTLFIAPVSNSVLILRFKFLLANVWNTVPVVGPNSSMLYTSTLSATAVK